MSAEMNVAAKVVEAAVTSQARRDEKNQSPTEPIKLAGRKPWGLAWRTSSWYITAVVAVGVATDAISYSIVVPVIPFRLQALNYSNISALTSWLLFAYSGGIFISTFPVAYFFGRYPWRREPLVVAVCALEGSVVLFMLATPYWLLLLSRFVMGAASSVIWVVGFALICENVVEKNIGRQTGFVFSGVAVGVTIAPPIGGALYDKLGWRAPFIFTIIICAVDLLARLLVIEQKDLRKWRIEALEASPGFAAEEKPAESGPTVAVSDPSVEDKYISSRPPSDHLGGVKDLAPPPPATISDQPERNGPVTKPETKKLSPWGVLVALARSPRGMSSFLMTFVFGLAIGALDSTLTLRIENIWRKNSNFAGLVYLAAAAPTFVTGPLVGAIADKYGAEFVMTPWLLLSLPWAPLMILTESLPGFILFFALLNICLTCMFGPVGLEVTIAAREVEGMSEIYQFASMNIAYAISTSVGAIAGGQMYNSLPSGWAAVCWFTFAWSAVSLPVPFCFSGNRPLLRRIMGWRKEETTIPADVPLGDPPDTAISRV